MSQKPRNTPSFELSMQLRSDGKLQAVLITFRHGAVAETRELQEDTLLAHYGADGALLSVEMLGPVKLSVFTKALGADGDSHYSKIVQDRVPDFIANDAA